MSSRNALLEWLEQVKKLSKSRDYVCLDLIDKLFEVLPAIDRNMLRRHKEFLDDICTRYHKPNPLDKRVQVVNVQQFKCLANHHKCDIINRFAEASIVRSEIAQKDILWQWFEIIDFMFERPELIHPSSIDEYIEGQINFVCRKYRKNNPLNESIRRRFGRYWKDAAGKWRKERRNRERRKW